MDSFRAKRENISPPVARKGVVCMNGFYCRGDGQYHYKNELPASLRSFWDYTFSSGVVAGDDFKSFNTKFKNAIKKALPAGYVIHDWHKNHYECSWVVKTPSNHFIYSSVSDVRFFPNEWATDILIRTMKHDKDWSGGHNQRTSIFSYAADLERIELDVLKKEAAPPSLHDVIENASLRSGAATIQSEAERIPSFEK